MLFLLPKTSVMDLLLPLPLAAPAARLQLVLYHLTVEVQHLQHLLLQQNLVREAMKLSTGTAQSRLEHLVAPMLTILLILNMKLRVSLTINLRFSPRSTTTTRMEATTATYSGQRRTRQLILGWLMLKKKMLVSIPQAGIAPPSSTLLPRLLSNLLPPSQFSPPAT